MSLKTVLIVVPNIIRKPAAHQFLGGWSSALWLCRTPAAPWPLLGCESAMPTFGPEEFFKGCSGVALQEGLAVLVVPFSLWKERRVRGGGDCAVFSRVGVKPRCFFFS